jgi:ribonuclease BN (tRNA processing enzyme)
MRVTVLGSSASYSGAGRACAGHYLEAAGARVLLDCGNGVLSNLASIEDPVMLDAVFITHNHPDHYADVFVLHAALRYAPQGPAAPIPLYAPPGLPERMKLLLSDRGAESFDEAFVTMPLEAGVAVTVGGLTVTPFEVEHTDPTFALVCEADSARFAYTADTAPCPGAREAARGADLLLAEATLPEQYQDAAPHMTATQAGELAAEAGVAALALVHVWPTNDRDLMARLASEAFGSTVVVANEFDVFDITSCTGKDD